MKSRSLLAAVAALVSALALPLGAQEAATATASVSTITSASDDSLRPVRTATIVVTAERPSDRQHLLRLDRGNRFLSRELRAYDERVARLEAHLGALKERAARRQAEVGSLEAQRNAARAERARLEARLMAAEAALSSPRASTGSAGSGAS